MSEPAKSGEIIPLGSDDLASLARQINEELNALKQGLMSNCQRAIALGKLLLRAKDLVEQQLGPGHWTEWQANNTKVHERMAQRAMDLARKEAELLAKGADLSALTTSGAIRLLEDLRDPEDKSGITNRSSASKTRKSPVDSAIQKDAVEVLKKAWRKCNDDQKTEFRQHIGQQ
jgi:hypothetical protein